MSFRTVARRWQRMMESVWAHGPHERHQVTCRVGDPIWERIRLLDFDFWDRINSK